MKILHYFLGFPPYRSGGLTKYSMDLMVAQVQRGHTVMALWPGMMGFEKHKTAFRRHRAVDGIESFELINPLPVPLDEGITDVDAYTVSGNRSAYLAFLRRIAPDAIHIHTLMGLHREFLEAAETLSIRTVFTTHDYFGLCPKVTMYRDGKACRDDHGCEDCGGCNARALSLTKIRLLQSPLYRQLKNMPLVKLLRKQHRQNFFEETAESAGTPMAHTAAQYRRLREFYIDMLSRIDVIHFNSTLAQEVYTRFLTPKNMRMINITHRDIADRRFGEHHDCEVLRIVYLAPPKPFKGYGVLKKALDELWEQGKRDFELHLFYPLANPAPYMRVHEEGFAYEQMPQLFADADVLFAPSLWYETFGFTVLEAVSHGVPVVVSKNVGAKDVVGSGGILVEPGDHEAIMEIVRDLTPQRLEQLRRNIQQECRVVLWEDFLNENDKLYSDSL